MPFKVSDEEKPKFNKRVQESFTLLSEQLEDVAFQGAASEEPAIELDSIRDADGNIISNSLDLFSTPLNGDKSKALGLVDADGNATDKGELFFNMKEAGMFDDTGVITDKGKAYLMKPIELKDPKNLPAFTQLWDDGVIRGDETTWKQKGEALMDFGGNILGGIGEMGSNFGKNLYYQLDNRKGFAVPYFRSKENDNTPEWLKAENVAVNLSVGEKIATNFMEMGRMADIAGSWVADKMMDPAYWGQNETPAREDSKALYASRQRQWAMRETLKDLEVGEVAEMITEVKGIVDEAEKAKEVIGEERFKKIVERTGATTEMFGSPENLIPASFALNLGKLVPLGNRASIGAQKVLSKVLIKEAEIGALETSLEAAKLTVEKGAISNRLTSRFIEESAEVSATPVAISRGEKAAEIAARTAKITDEATAAIPRLTSNLDEAVKLRNSLSTRIPETAANATLKTLEAGRQLRGLPAKAIGGALEGFGNTLTKIDGSISNFLKERGLDQMYSAALGAAGVVGVAGSPVIGAIGAGAAALKAGKMITNYGKLFKYVGKEMVKVKGQIPFWRRVAAHTEAGSLNRGIAHTFNMLDLGGVTSDTLRRIPRGIAAAAPSDLMFEWLSDGADMRPETLYQALAESVYIGGSFAAAGGAFMGTKTRMRQLAIGDQLNFNQSLTDPRQKVLYNQLDPGTRNSIATYSIANPTLNYVFKDNGVSNYDPNTNTATINVNSNNSIKPLIAHETLHHTLIKNNMEAGISALFLGDTVNNTVGGLLRSRDGKLDPNFKAFTDAYYQRLNIAGMTDAEKNAIYPLDKMAVEYFIEQHSDQYAGMAESGELGAIAASGDIKRKLSGVLETILPRIPVLRDLHFKSGGMIDKDGGWVTGNGILDAGGVKTNPITKKMFRDMNRRSSGLAPGQFEPLVSDKQDSGAQLSLDPSNPIDSELLHPLVKVDENGSPVLVDGKPVALDKVILLQRALAGLTAKEVMTRKRAENYIPEKGEAFVDDTGEFQPGWLSNDILAEMFAKNSFNPEQKRIIREMNRMIRKGDGGRAVMINFPATTRNKAGKVVYKAQEATLRDTVPVAITISKDGNLLFGLMSVNKLQENIQKRSQSRRGKKLYGGNVDLILRDTQAMMQFHKDGVDSIEYFKEKYGAVEATERKNFINTMFGLLNQKEQAVLNPMLIEDGVKSRDNVYRTYRADRVSKAVAMSPDDYPAMPFSYEAVSQVKMPEQSRQMPEGKYDQETVIQNKQVIADRFEGFRPQVGVKGLTYGWQRPSDGKFIKIDQHQFLYRDDNGNQLGDPLAIGYVRIAREGNTLFYDGKPNAKQLKELKDTAIENNLDLQNSTPRYMPEKVDADYMRAVESGDVEMQQRITDETAKRNGATIGIVHHGTKQRFNEFESKRDPTGLIYFSFDEKFAKNYPRGFGGHRNPTPEIRQRIDAVRAESKKLFDPLAEELDKTYPTAGNTTEEGLNAWSKYFDDQKAWEKSKLDGMTVSEAEMGMGIQVIPAYLFTKKIFDPAQNWKEFKSEILDALNEKSINDLMPQTIKAIEDGNYIIWERKNIIDAVFNKYDALILNESGSKNIAVRDPSLIKRADPITRDDSGNIIPPSKRFNTESKDIRYMPEPIPANYKSSRDDTYLRASLGPDGRMNATRPFKSTEALPTIAMRHDYPLQELVVSKFDKKESIIYAKNKNGEDISFKFDPAMMNEPEFADFDDLYDGKVIQFAMADRHSAVDGDMGGHSFPDLKVNQENILTDQNGKKYKIVWANNAWGPVANMSNKATKFGATSLLTYNMDQHAHDSNTRTVRIFSNEIANSGLSVADQSTILIVQNVALKKSQTSASKKDLRAFIANRNKLNKQLIIDDKILAGKKVKDATKLSIEDRDALINSINDADLLIKNEEEFLKESLGAKAATPEETQVDKLFREYQTKRRAYEKDPSSERKKKSMEDSEVNLRKHQKTKGFAAAEKLLPSRELDKFSNTFKGRKSLINAVKTKTAAAKWGKFDAQKISETIGDQLTGDSLHVVGAVELSSDPNFKALYLGDDPKEIARMTPAEQAAAAQLKANPDFVAHEAYLWVMLGPAESKHYFNTNQRSVLDSVPDFIDQYSQLPVKGDKKKLNDPESKASEFNIVNTARDQSKIPVVFKAKPKQNNEKQK